MAHETESGERENNWCGQQVDISEVSLAQADEVLNEGGGGGKEKKG